MFDSAVIGGGLAGCLAAITLAQQNHRVVLLEAKPYPHHKVCGEFLSPECLPLLAEIGFRPILEQLKPITIRKVRITAPDGSQWRAQFPSEALSISRYALDSALASYAKEMGVAVHEGVRVTEIKGALAQGFSLSTRGERGESSFQAASVIAAHGKRSNLDRALKRPFLQQNTSFYLGLKRHFNGPALGDQLDLHVFPGGYCGMSDVEGGKTNVCLLVQQQVFQQSFTPGRSQIEQFIDWMGRQNEYLGDWLSKATPAADEWISIGQVPLGSKSPLEGDILMAGDSAGMVAPLAGDGMTMALHSGKLAAHWIDRYLTHQLSAQELKQIYARQWRSTFSARIRLTRLLHSVILRPALLSPSLRLLNLFPALGDFLVMQTRDLRLIER